MCQPPLYTGPLLMQDLQLNMPNGWESHARQSHVGHFLTLFKSRTSSMDVLRNPKLRH